MGLMNVYNFAKITNWHLPFRFKATFQSSGGDDIRSFSVKSISKPRFPLGTDSINQYYGTTRFVMPTIEFDKATMDITFVEEDSGVLQDNLLANLGSASNTGGGAITNIRIDEYDMSMTKLLSSRVYTCQLKSVDMPEYSRSGSASIVTVTAHYVVHAIYNTSLTIDDLKNPAGESTSKKLDEETDKDNTKVGDKSPVDDVTPATPPQPPSPPNRPEYVDHTQPFKEAQTNAADAVNAQVAELAKKFDTLDTETKNKLIEDGYKHFKVYGPASAMENLAKVQWDELSDDEKLGYIMASKNIALGDGVNAVEQDADGYTEAQRLAAFLLALNNGDVDASTTTFNELTESTYKLVKANKDLWDAKKNWEEQDKAENDKRVAEWQKDMDKYKKEYEQYEKDLVDYYKQLGIDIELPAEGAPSTPGSPTPLLPEDDGSKTPAKGPAYPYTSPVDEVGVKTTKTYGKKNDTGKKVGDMVVHEVEYTLGKGAKKTVTGSTYEDLLIDELRQFEGKRDIIYFNKDDATKDWGGKSEGGKRIHVNLGYGLTDPDKVASYLGSKDAKITVVNKNTNQTFTGTLVEVDNFLYGEFQNNEKAFRSGSYSKYNDWLLTDETATRIEQGMAKIEAKSIMKIDQDIRDNMSGEVLAGLMHHNYGAPGNSGALIKAINANRDEIITELKNNGGVLTVATAAKLFKQAKVTPIGADAGTYWIDRTGYLTGRKTSITTKAAGEKSSKDMYESETRRVVR